MRRAWWTGNPSTHTRPTATSMMSYLCAGEDDWYVFDTDGIGFGEYWFYIRALIKDAGLCGEGCGDPVIRPGRCMR